MRKFSKIVIILSVLIVTSASIGFTMTNLIPELLNTGMQFYTAKDYAGAADYLGQVVDMVPNHDQARYYLVYSLSLSGHHDKALAHAKVLEKRQPDQKEYQTLANQMQKNFNAHVKTRAKARKHSTIPKTVIIGGYDSLTEIRNPRISAQPSKIVKPRKKTQPDKIDKPLKKTPLEKAINSIDEAKYDKAETQLKEILKKDSNNAETMHYLGVVSLNQGDHYQAQEWFSKAVTQDPKHFQSRFLLGDSYRATGELEKAEKHFRKALSIKEDIFAQLNLAVICLQLNKLEEAEKYFKKILAKDSNISEAKLGLAEVKLLTGKISEATNMTREVLASRPDNPSALNMHALVLLENKLPKDARDEAMRACEKEPGNAKYQTTYARALAKTGNYEAAIHETEQILDDNPSNIEARLVLAETLMTTGSLGSTIDHLDKIDKVRPNAKSSFIRASLLVKYAKIPEAKEAFIDYVSLSSGCPEPAMQYAQFLETYGFTQEAFRAYNEITELYPETTFAIQASKAANRLNDSNSFTTTQPDRQLRPGKVKY